MSIRKGVGLYTILPEKITPIYSYINIEYLLMDQNQIHVYTNFWFTFVAFVTLRYIIWKSIEIVQKKVWVSFFF